MNIKILGCSGGKSLERAPTSFLVDNHILIDAGTVMNKLDSEEILNIDHLLFTHAHFDHIADLPFLALNLMEEKTGDFNVYAAKETTEWVFSHILNNKIWPDLFNISRENNGNLYWNTFEHLEKFKIDNYEIISIPVNHSVPTNGFIIDDGEYSFAFTGDTYITEEFWERCNKKDNLKAVIADVCLPNELIDLAEKVLHLTPNNLSTELEKLSSPEVTVFINHIKPGLRDQVIEEIDEIDCINDIIILEEDMVIDI